MSAVLLYFFHSIITEPVPRALVPWQSWAILNNCTVFHHHLPLCQSNYQSGWTQSPGMLLKSRLLVQDSSKLPPMSSNPRNYSVYVLGSKSRGASEKTNYQGIYKPHWPEKDTWARSPNQEKEQITGSQRPLDDKHHCKKPTVILLSDNQKEEKRMGTK